MARFLPIAAYAGAGEGPRDEARFPVTERIGLAVAVLGHVAAVLAILWFGQHRESPPPAPAPIEITIAEDTGVQAAAPQAAQAPAEAQAPEQGPRQEAAPAAVQAPAPEPAPPIRPAPPAPAPRPPAPVVERHEAPAPHPAPRAPPRPRPTPAAAAPAPPAPRAPPRHTAPAPPAAGRTVAANGRGSGSTANAPSNRARSSRLGPDFLRGLSDRPAPANAPAAQATMTGEARQNIGRLIQAQVQPCANRQNNPGPGAERIRVTINLRIARDGSLVGRPRIVGHDGVDDDNQIYVDPIDRNALATFVGCSPLHGLPADLYDVPGGWSNFTLRYSLPR